MTFLHHYSSAPVRCCLVQHLGIPKASLVHMWLDMVLTNVDTIRGFFLGMSDQTAPNVNVCLSLPLTWITWPMQCRVLCSILGTAKVSQRAWRDAQLCCKPVAYNRRRPKQCVVLLIFSQCNLRGRHWTAHIWEAANSDSECADCLRCFGVAEQDRLECTKHPQRH